MKKRTKGVLAAALAAAGVFLLAGLDARLLVRAYTVESGRLTGPVRLAVLTDLHACAYGEGQRELLDAVAEQSPDLVLLCGDIVDDEPRMPEERALDTVEALAAVWPTYYVTGNHEFWTGRVDEVKARLEERGAVKNENATVTSRISKEDAQKSRLDEMMEDTFEGSMPAFLAAFSRTKRLPKSEVKQLQDFIDSYQEEGEP